jgi:hypothetical protein
VPKHFGDTADLYWLPDDGTEARPIVGWHDGERTGVAFPLIVTRKGAGVEIPTPAEPGKIIRSPRAAVLAKTFDRSVPELDQFARKHPGVLFVEDEAGDIREVSCG